MAQAAHWIWTRSGHEYNSSIIARRTFTLDAIRSGVLKITADSWYRLVINGQWIADGPARGWPENIQYDEIDITECLGIGDNEIVVVARFFGTGTFHQIPRRPGLLSLLSVIGDERTVQIATDRDWEVARYAPLERNTPKVSIQMEPFELMDARNTGAITYEAATQVASAGAEPWSGLSRRSTRLLTDEPVHAVDIDVHVVRRPRQAWTIPAARILYPGRIEANHSLSVTHGVVTVIRSPEAREVTVVSSGYRCYLDGDPVDHQRPIALDAGNHWLVALAEAAFGHRKDFDLSFDADIELTDPRRTEATPFAVFGFRELEFADDDLQYFWFPRPREREIAVEYARLSDEIGRAVIDSESYDRVIGSRAIDLDETNQPAVDVHGQFVQREPLDHGEADVLNVDALLHDNADRAIIGPSADGDTEVVLDFGDQVCGYYEFDLTAGEGTVIDLFGVEYIRRDGVIQHTEMIRNGCRYVCAGGQSRFLSFKRRSGRYLFVIFRKLTHPVSIRLVRIRESIYPRRLIGRFSSSDPLLDRIWQVSERTLALCMEDTFTDCPLYEQTLWVGDARNESLFALDTFGSDDIVRRCIEIAAESLDRYPIVGCQVPTSWDTLLPAWSFLWGISVWDYYFYSGDVQFLKRIWPRVLQNLDGAFEMLDERGLFSGPHWNMFDWSGLDHQHRTVLHNSMFLIGALDAAIRCADVLGKPADSNMLAGRRQSLSASIEASWRDDIQAYPDSYHDDGTASQSTSQHTAFLSLLYDIVSDDHKEGAVSAMVDPPDGMVRVGSPFAILYLYEALERAGLHERIIDSIYESFEPMVADGATTVWEVFPQSPDHPPEFPTRSHVHAWSSAPLSMLPRVVLGIKQVEAAGMRYEISPHPCGLSHASGRVATVRGPLSVEWRMKEMTLDIIVGAPTGTDVQYVTNTSIEGYEIRFKERS